MVVQSDYPPAGDATRVMSAPAAPAGYAYGDQTQQAITITCPVCSTPNGPGEAYCQDCGMMFGSAAGDIEPLPDMSQLPRLLDAATNRELALNPGLNTVGRENADVVLPDPTVSRRHAQVTLSDGRLLVEDLGSTNGTFVGGRPVRAGESATAFSGDAVRFGNVNLTLALPGAPERPADAAPDAAPVAAAPAEDRGEPIATLRLADGIEFSLYEGVNSIGRRSSNNIVLPDAFASGKHAEIECGTDGTATLTDLGSTNGTFINGERVAPHTPLPLVNGSAFRLAKSEVTFYSTAAPAAETPADAEATSMAVPVEEEPAPESVA
ncbi:MAG: FHA domain-containing protein [Actinomycetota bacterium]